MGSGGGSRNGVVFLLCLRDDSFPSGLEVAVFGWFVVWVCLLRTTSEGRRFDGSAATAVIVYVSCTHSSCWNDDSLGGPTSIYLQFS